MENELNNAFIYSEHINECIGFTFYNDVDVSV